MANVDVIMAAYNEEMRVSISIESILTQTYTDWRLLICDDGSKDRTFEIISEYALMYPGKIIALKNNINKGLTYTLNKLISMSNAKYVARMDADDKSRPDRLLKQVSFLDANMEYAMVGTAVEKYDENGFFARTIYPEKPDKKSFLWNSPFAHPTIMIRKDVIKDLNGYKDESRTLRCEDYDLWMRLYAKGYKGYNLQEPLFEYYEGRYSYNKRKFKYRISEMRTRYYGFKKMNLLPGGLIYVIKPLIIGIIPNQFIAYIKKR